MTIFSDTTKTSVANCLLALALLLTIIDTASAQPGNSAEARGLLGEQVRHFDYDLDGDPDFTIILTNSFDKRGRQTGETEVRLDDNDMLVRKSVGLTTLSRDGTVTGIDRLVDTNGDGNDDFLSRETRELNSRGDLVLRLTEIDWGMDGSIESVLVETRTYDKQGRIATYLVEQDSNNDGTVDYTTGNRYEFNRRNDLKRFYGTTDGNNDGTPDLLAVLEYSHARNGDFTGYVQQIDRNADGTYDATNYATFELNNRGSVVHWEIESDLNNDGIIDSGQTIIRSY